jgi:phosphonate utilization transcriptional regulator
MSFPDALNVLKSRSLPALVQEELERMIIDGRLLPGEPLREVALSALLGVSRGPIREAFRGLEEKGLVTVVKNCGVHVRTLDVDEADQIYEVRAVLEGMIGAKAAREIGPEGCGELRALIASMEEAVSGSDINRYTALNFHLHDRLAALAGNRKLHETYNRLVSELALFRRQTYVHNEASLALSLEEHKAIVSAVCTGDAERAATLLQAHTRDSRSRMHQVLDPADPIARSANTRSPE